MTFIEYVLAKFAKIELKLEEIGDGAMTPEQAQDLADTKAAVESLRLEVVEATVASQAATAAAVDAGVKAEAVQVALDAFKASFGDIGGLPPI